MHKSAKFLSFLFIMALLMIAGSVKAAHLRGRVIVSGSGEVITGATVRLEGEKEYSALSGLDGSFEFSHVKKGHYTLKVTMVGYGNEQVTLTLGEHGAEFQEIALKEASAELTSVTVRAANGGGDDAGARRREKNADRVISIVSARAIELSPDITVANVIARVSGVTVERNSTGDGQYALLRGMDKRYNYTLVNGVKIPSPDNKNRFVPLDIFPAELLERLEVNKSLTPDMEADGIGGAVDLVLKDAPQSRLLSANISTGASSLFFNRSFYSFDKSDIQRLSPFEQYGANFPARAKDFNAGLLDMQRSSLKPNFSGGFSYGDRFFHRRLGVLVSGTYQNSYRGSNSTYYSFNTATSDASNLPVLTGLNNRTFSEQQQRAGLHAKLDYDIANGQKLELYGALLDFKTYQVRDERETNLSVGYEPEKGNYNLGYDRRFRFQHQNILTSTLKGTHKLTNRVQLSWTAVYAKAKNELPDNSQVHLTSTVRNGIENRKSVVVLGGAERRWEHNSDEDKAGYLNFSYRLGEENRPVVLSAGGMYRDKVRTNFFNEYQFRPLDPTKPEQTQKNLIEGVDWNQYSDISFTVFNPYGSTGDPLNYNATEKIAAGYLEGKVVRHSYELTTGVRIEHTDQGYHLDHVVEGLKSEGDQRYSDVLPSLNFKYKLNGQTNLRASYYRAINRPSFFEIIPYRIINEDFTEAGNPELKHTVADNADLRYEYFPRSAEQLMAGVFYKRIKDPIEFGMVLQGQGSFYMPGNFGTATNYGAELDYTKYFYHFGVKLNYTYTHSSITTSKLYYYNNPNSEAGGGNPDGQADPILVKNVDQTRRLAGQAAHVAGLTGLYKSLKKGIDGQLSVSYTGDRLYAVSRYIDNDIWESGFIQMDASVEKSLKKHFVLFVKASNLLNTPVKKYIKRANPANERVEGYTSYKGGTVTQSDRYGQTLMIGLRFKW